MMHLPKMTPATAALAQLRRKLGLHRCLAAMIGMAIPALALSQVGISGSESETGKGTLSDAVQRAASPKRVLAKSSAPSVAVMLDDSSGMCGYLTPGSRFKQMLAVLQGQFEQSRVFAGARLSLLGEEGWEPAVPRLDALVSTASGGQRCPFRKTTSPLGRFFKRADDAPLAFMVTDMIFDEGRGSNLAAGRIEFVEAALRWQQASPDNTGLGIIALRSEFDGEYFPGQRSSAKTGRLQADQRPVYLVWRAKQQPEAAQFINELVAALKPKVPAQGGPAPTSHFVLMPAPGVDRPVSFQQPLFLSQALRMAGESSPKPQFVYQFLASANPRAELQPEACLEWRGGQLLLDPRCTSSGPGVRGQNFGQLGGQVEWAHAVFDLGPAGQVARRLTRSGTAGPDGGVRLCTADLMKFERLVKPSAETKPEDKPRKEFTVELESQGACNHVQPRSLLMSLLKLGERRSVAILSLRPAAPVVNAVPVHRSSWTEQWLAPAAAATGSKTALGEEQLTPWDAASEPCAPAQAEQAECMKAAQGTVGFKPLVASLTARLDPVGAQRERMNADAAARFELVVAKKKMAQP